jgi:hypothetical protein
MRSTRLQSPWPLGTRFARFGGNKRRCVCTMIPFRFLRVPSELSIASIAVGCEAPRHLPDFMARSQEDCWHGDQLACQTVEIFPPHSDKAAEPIPAEAHSTQVQRGVEAVESGILRARRYAADNGTKLAPTSAG